MRKKRRTFRRRSSGSSVISTKRRIRVSNNVFKNTDSIVPLKVSLSTVLAKEDISSWVWFKLNAIKFELLPRFNTVGSTYISNQSAPSPTNVPVAANNMVAVFVRSNDVSVSSADELLQVENATLHKFNSRIVKYCKVRPTCELPISGDTSATTALRRNLWMSTDDVAAQFGTLYVGNLAVTPDTNSSTMFQDYDIFCTCYFSLKKYIG